jgi:hypothetical protein
VKEAMKNNKLIKVAVERKKEQNKALREFLKQNNINPAKSLRPQTSKVMSAN